MTPTAPAFLSRYRSPIGTWTLAFIGGDLVGLWCEGAKHFGSTIAGMTHTDDISVLEPPSSIKTQNNLTCTTRWLDTYFAGHIPDEVPALRLVGTDFQVSVWRELLTIPYGQTTTYGDLADAVADQRASGLAGQAGQLTCQAGRPAPQAVGQTVGRNPISLIVPCHRVVAADGSLTGYAAGTDRKAWLLELEGAQSAS